MGTELWHVSITHSLVPIELIVTQVVTRFFMGYYPSKIVTLLNIILMEGYATIDCIIGGQVLSAVSGGSMSIAVGIVIVALVEVTLAAFGLKVFHVYERLVHRKLPGQAIADSQQFRLASAGHCPLRPHRISWLKLQSFLEVIGLRRNTRCKPAILLLIVSIHSQLVGCSSFGLLRVLPCRHAEVEDLLPHLCRIGSVILVCGLGRHWIGLWDRDESGLGSRVRHFVGCTHCRWVQSSG